ncbi:unnamed protein product [Caenorhabditis nigoni]
MCPASFWRKVRPNPLVFIFCVSSCCFTFGLCIAIYDINNFGSGLYLALVSIVTVVVVLAFCLVGTEDQEPSSRMPAGIEIRIVNIDLEAEGARSSSSSDDHAANDSSV